MTSLPGPIGPPKTLEGVARRVRARRTFALAAMLTAIGGLVGVRAALAPAPSGALSSSGLAAPVHQGSGTHKRAHRGGSHQAAGTRPAIAPSRSSAPAAHRVLVGNAYDVSYGIVQVKVTMSGNRITNVRALSLPQGGRSSDISNYAAPMLRREALSVQSAHIDTVSGASYTSAGYARSLQSALDQRGG